jgi:ABC-2 type transport system permease protein
MRNVLPIARRELIAYFYSPIAYNVLAVFLFICGIFFSAGMGEGQANMRGIFYNMGIVLLILSPLITMRLMSEEMKMGTIEPLMTAPVTDTEVIVGKFLSAMAVYLLLLLPTLAYPFMLSRLGQLEWGAIWSAYLGLALIGCVYISVGLLISCMTKDQVIAGVVGIMVLLFLWLVDIVTRGGTDWRSESIRYVTLFYHFDTFVKGLVDTRDIIFYLSLSAFFLFLSVRILEARKWR